MSLKETSISGISLFEPSMPDSIKERLTKTQAVGFDLDDTLVQSITIKSQIFADTFGKLIPGTEPFKTQIQKSFFQVSSGLTRLQVIEQVLVNFTNLSPTDEIVDQISRVFSQISQSVDFPLYEDTIPTLDYLSQKGYVLFLSSTRPAEDLEESLLKSQIRRFFDEVYGFRKGFRKEIHHLPHFSQTRNIEFGQIVFVGDGLSDVIAARNVGGVSIMVSSNGKFPDLGQTSVKPDIIIPNLASLKLLL